MSKCLIVGNQKKVVDWDVKNKIKQKQNLIFSYRCKDSCELTLNSNCNVSDEEEALINIKVRLRVAFRKLLSG